MTSLAAEVGRMTFDEMFRDPRWKDLRSELLDEAEWACQECGAAAPEDGVHICYYPKKKQVWEYPRDAFRVLCSTHKAERASFERDLRAALSGFTTEDLGVFLDVLDELRGQDQAERSRSMETLRGVIKGSRSGGWPV